VDWTPVPEPFILGYRVLVQNTLFSNLVAWNESFIRIGGLHSNTTYIIKVYPVHGLKDERSSDATAQNITVTTEPDRGKSILRNSQVNTKFKQNN